MAIQHVPSRAEILCGFLGLTLASLRLDLSPALHTTHGRGAGAAALSQHPGAAQELPDVLLQRMHLPPAATRQRVLRERGTAPPRGAQGSEELAQAVSEQGWGSHRSSPRALSLSLRCPAPG